MASRLGGGTAQAILPGFVCSDSFQVFASRNEVVQCLAQTLDFFKIFFCLRIVYFHGNYNLNYSPDLDNSPG